MKDQKSRLANAIRPAMRNDSALGSRVEIADRILGIESSAPRVQPTNSASNDAPVKQNRTAQPRHQVVRDTFTIPADEYHLVKLLRRRAFQNGREATKSEIIRAGLKLLSNLEDRDIVDVLNRLPRVRAGRPPKDDDTKTDE